MSAEPVVDENADEFRDLAMLKRHLAALDAEFKNFKYTPTALNTLVAHADSVFHKVGTSIVQHFKTHLPHDGLPPASQNVYASWINLSGAINRMRALTHSDLAALSMALDNTSVLLENLKSAKRTVELSNYLTSAALDGGDVGGSDKADALILQRFTREPLTSFDDIIGMAEEKRRITSVTTLAKYGLNANSYGAMLLYGPPGTGKSTFVEAAARHMDAQYVFLTNSDLFLATFGAAESLLASIFNAASSVAAARSKMVLLFFDEIDTITGRDSTEVKASLTAVFLHHLDAKRLSRNVFVAAATNYIDRVDSAIARRLMPAIHLGLPTADVIATMLCKLCVFLPDTAKWAHSMAQASFSQANVKTVVNSTVQALKMWSISPGLFKETDGGYGLPTLGTSMLLKRGYSRVWPQEEHVAPNAVWFSETDIDDRIDSIVYVLYESQLNALFVTEINQIVVS